MLAYFFLFNVLLTSVFVCSVFITATWTVLKVLVPEEQTSYCVCLCVQNITWPMLLKNQVCFFSCH